jgi:hypothetical protein
MAQRQHHVAHLAHCPSEWGAVTAVIATADSAAAAFLLETRDSRNRLAFRGRIAAESEHPADMFTFSLSFDGAKLAVASRSRDERRHNDVSVNGEVLYRMPYDVIHYFDWIDNERLAWEAWNRDALHAKDDRIHVFLNGEDRTDFDFQPILLERHAHAVCVREGDVAYVVYEDGSRSEPKRLEGDVSRHDLSRELFPARMLGEGPQVARDEARRKVRVAHGGYRGPWFDGIEADDGMGSAFALSADGRRLGYVGMRYSGVANVVSRAFERLMERAEEAEERTGKSPGWAMKLAMLFTPYGGRGHAFIEGSRRYHPVDDRREWAKRYRHAGDQFYTPAGELVVTCADGRALRVVIDEDEGPPFDGVHNVRALPDGRVCYVANRDRDFFRVTVAP